MKTEIAIILDRSGSMGLRREDVIHGFNTLLKTHQSEPGECAFSLIQFDDQYEVNCWGIPVAHVQPLTGMTYVPRGCTALRDAIGRTITDLGRRLEAMPEVTRPQKVVVVIITDGLENASHEYSTEQIRTMIEHQRVKYAWDISFVGTNQDAVLTAREYAIPQGHAINYANTGGGVGAAFMAVEASVLRSRRGQDAAYTVGERAAAADTDEDLLTKVRDNA